VAEAEEHERLLAWVERGQVVLGDWISHEMPWTEYQAGFERVANKTGNKVVLTF
jgi:threonine dehydrogenase-like Zn-dependent dehydrogenase